MIQVAHVAAGTSKPKVVAKFKQFYEGEEAKAEDYYCVLTVPVEKKALLLGGDKASSDEVMVALFRAELLLIGDGLIHRLDFIEVSSLADHTKFWSMEL